MKQLIDDLKKLVNSIDGEFKRLNYSKEMTENEIAHAKVKLENNKKLAAELEQKITDYRSEIQLFEKGRLATIQKREDELNSAQVELNFKIQEAANKEKMAANTVADYIKRSEELEREKQKYQDLVNECNQKKEKLDKILASMK